MDDWRAEARPDETIEAIPSESELTRPTSLPRLFLKGIKREVVSVPEVYRAEDVPQILDLTSTRKD
jgi:hypothetical protein